jgi:hypothetical protein
VTVHSIGASQSLIVWADKTVFDLEQRIHQTLVRAVGVEPTRRCHRGILSPLRLPVPPRPLWSPDQGLSAFSGEVELG